MEVERLNAAEPIVTSAMLREAGVDGEKAIGVARIQFSENREREE